MLPTLTLRPEHPDDYPRVAALLSIGYAEPVTAEQVAEWRANELPDRISYRVVAADPAGQAIGYAHALHDTWHVPGLFWLHAAVDPAARGRSLGARLYDDVADFARRQGATLLRAEARDAQPEGLRFAERRGFVVERHIFESTLDLAVFDETPFLPALTAAQATDICFFSLADVGDTDGTRRRLHALNEALVLDIPGRDPTPRPYGAFAKEIFASAWFRSDGQIVAADGDTWIGISAVAIYPESHSAYNLMTGVIPAYRGRGIALALKLLALRCARRYGAESIRTNNDSENAPMLAVNRKLGYRPELGYSVLRREPARTDQP
jgi:GNAT superfamily N-acetyltransferase